MGARIKAKTRPTRLGHLGAEAAGVGQAEFPAGGIVGAMRLASGVPAPSEVSVLLPGAANDTKIRYYVANAPALTTFIITRDGIRVHD